METVLRLALTVLGLLAVTVLIEFITHNSIIKLHATPVESIEVATVKEREKQLDCLAMNIYREAGYEHFEGKVAVAQVTMNRVASPSFPNDVCGVVLQKNIFVEKVVCQFSWYCDSATKARPVNKAVYNESYEVAKKVLLEGFSLPSLTDALYYHADYINPNWNLDKVIKIGHHIFYKPKGVKYAQL